MKIQLLAVSFFVLMYHTATVDGKCTICAYKKPKDSCTDTYIPNGLESTACEGPIDGSLCSKYGGGYSIYCESLNSYTSCDKRQSPCPGSAGRVRSLYWATLLSVFVAIAASFRFQ